jgi:hypothetical protein
MIRTLTLANSGAFQIVHDDLVQVSGDNPRQLPEPISGAVLQRLLELRESGHFEVHYEQRDAVSFTHLRPSEAPLVEVYDDIRFPGFSTIHDNISLLAPPTLVDFVEEPYEGLDTTISQGETE